MLRFKASGKSKATFQFKIWYKISTYSKSHFWTHKWSMENRLDRLTPKAQRLCNRTDFSIMTVIKQSRWFLNVGTIKNHAFRSFPKFLQEKRPSKERISTWNNLKTKGLWFYHLDQVKLKIEIFIVWNIQPQQSLLLSLQQLIVGWKFYFWKNRFYSGIILYNCKVQDDSSFI